MSDNENNQEGSGKLAPVVDISNGIENKRLTKIWAAEEAANAFADQLQRFPDKPRGFYTSMEKATDLAWNKCMKDEPDEMTGLYKAAEFLKKLADREGLDMGVYQPPPPRKPKNTPLIMYDLGSIQETMLRMTGEYFRESGKVRKPDIESLARMALCFIEFEKDGLPLPVSRILPEHLQYDRFVSALKKDGVLDKVGRTVENIAKADKGTRGRIQQAARRRLESAGKFFAEVIHARRNTPPANETYKEIVNRARPPNPECEPLTPDQ